MAQDKSYKFCFGPWNLSEGQDPYGPPTRPPQPFDWKLAQLKKEGFDAMMFHDDDAVPDMDALRPEQMVRKAAAVKRALDKHGLKAEFVAPRLWEGPKTIDGGYTSNDAKCRKYAIQRSLRCIDIADALGTNLIVLWLAREGTYVREAKDSKLAVGRLVEAIDAMLAYHPKMRIAIEPKPNEPMDQAYIPTTGHAVALAARTCDPSRVGVNIESAHAILAGLDPSDEMGFALAFDKLWTVHLNDQNGLKFDQDKTFGSVDLRRAFNQVRILDRHDYGRRGEVVGLDVKAMRTQRSPALEHLSNSRKLFLALLKVSRGLSDDKIDSLVAERNYEALELYIVQSLMGK